MVRGRCLLVVCTLCLSGCGVSRHFASKRVDRLLLFLSPTAMNFDGQPGLDGFSGTLYGYRRDQPKSVALEDGELELLLFAGVLKGRPLTEGADQPTPVQVLRYDASQLKLHEVIFPIGVAYKFSNVRWDKSALPAGDITVVARFVPASGEALWTKPATLTLPK